MKMCTLNLELAGLYSWDPNLPRANWVRCLKAPSFDREGVFGAKWEKPKPKQQWSLQATVAQWARSRGVTKGPLSSPSLCSRHRL